MISVMMPVYNAEKYVGEAIESILNQTYTDFELVIVNDGSKDRSEDIILSYSDPRINYIKQDNGGEGAARNTALQHIKGEYVVFQDADDVSLPIRLEKLHRNFYSEQIGIVHSDLLLINENGKPIDYWHSRNIERARLLRYFLKIGTPFMIPSSMVRRELFDNYMYMSYKIGTDADMIFKTSLNWESIHIPEPLLLYRRHEENVSKSTNYNTLFDHVNAFIRRHSFRELFPEIPWDNRDYNNNWATAAALLSFFLARRGLTVDSRTWFEKALKAVATAPSKSFVEAVGHYIGGEFMQALQKFKSIPDANKNAIVMNYMGEVTACLGQKAEALDNFTKALRINPEYQEAIENMKSLGSSINLHLVDTTFMKFPRG